MQSAFLIIAMVSILSGIILRVLSRRHLTELGQSMSVYNPRNWFQPPWKSVDYFTRKGLQLHITSVALILGGLVISLVASKW